MFLKSVSEMFLNFAQFIFFLLCGGEDDIDEVDKLRRIELWSEENSYMNIYSYLKYVHIEAEVFLSGRCQEHRGDDLVYWRNMSACPVR